MTDRGSGKGPAQAIEHRLVGIISIGDLVKSRIGELEFIYADDA